jgi:hypothetical protein
MSGSLGDGVATATAALEAFCLVEKFLVACAPSFHVLREPFWFLFFTEV